MNSAARALAKEMREISRRAFRAEWMDGLEFALWRIATSGGGPYGQTFVSRDDACKLLRMVSVADCWIVTNEAGDERAVPLTEWVSLFVDSPWMSPGPDPDDLPSRPDPG